VRGEWWDDLQIFWDDFSSDGQLSNLEAEDPSPDGRTDVGSLGLKAVIPAGGEVVLPLLITWHFPNLVDYFDVVSEQQGKIYHPHYTTRFSDAWQVAGYLFDSLEALEKKPGVSIRPFSLRHCPLMFLMRFPARPPSSGRQPASG